MSTLKADTIQNTSGGAATLTKQQAAKLWATLDADASTVVAFVSFNVSSVQDDAAGNYGVTATSAMSDANYYMAGVCSYTTQATDFDRYLSNRYSGGNIDARKTSTIAKTGSYEASYTDCYVVGIMFMGDLA